MKYTIFSFVCISSLAATLFSSCCSIVNGRSQEINVAASPSGARLMIDGQDRGTVPQTVLLKRNQSHTIRIEAPGYAPYETTLDSSASYWLIGNAAFGFIGFAGIAIDYSTGAVYVFDDVDVTLAPKMSIREVHGKPEGARQIAQLTRI